MVLNMLDPNIYTPEKINLIVKTLVTNVGIEVGLLLLLSFCWKFRRKWFEFVLILVVLVELFLFGRGNLITAPLEVAQVSTVFPNFGMDRYISSSDVQDFTGPHVYWNHLRVRQPFGPELDETELVSFNRLSKEVSMLPANLNTFNKKYNVSGYSAVVLENYANYWHSEEINSVDIQSLDDYRLRNLGVKYIITGFPQDYAANLDSHNKIWDEEVKVYQNDHVLNRAFIKGAGSVTLNSYTPTTINLEVHNQQSDQLVLTDSWYPGWKAYIDGQETDILPFETAFRQIDLESGVHQVTFRYEPDSVKIGTAITLATFIICCVVLLWPKNLKLPLFS